MHITQENTTNIRIGRDTKKEFDSLGKYGENANDILVRLIKEWKLAQKEKEICLFDNEK